MRRQIKTAAPGNRSEVEATTMKGYAAIPELLRRSGLDVVFSVPGATNVEWIAQGVLASSLRLVKTRHEETAVSAAMGFGRVTGAVGVCSVTRGPGFANSVNALRTAVAAHMPILLVVGESPATKTRTAQTIDQRAITNAVGAGFHHAARPDELECAYWDATAAARHHGVPQVLSIGDGLLDSDIDLERQEPPSPHVDRPDHAAVAAAVDVLARSERPLVLAGQGAVLSGCHDALRTLADTVGARVGCTLNANFFFSGHPNDLGLVGESSPKPVLDRLRETDVLLAVGASLDGYTTGRGEIFADATIIQCEIADERPLMASSPGLRIRGDAGASARALLSEWHRRGFESKATTGGVPTPEEVRASVLAPDVGHDPSRGLDVRHLYASLDARLPPDRVVISENGRSRATIATLVGAQDASSWMLSRGYGSIGLGLGMAVGAAAAAPGRPVVLFAGDASFMMAAQDLDAVRINGLDLTVIIRNDEQLGSELKYLHRYGLPTDTVQQNLPDISLLAQAFGGRGVVVRTEEELAALALPQPGLHLVDARIDPAGNWTAAIPWP